MLAAQCNKRIEVVADEVGCPTYSVDLAVFIHQLMNTEHYGIYHATNQGVYL